MGKALYVCSNILPFIWRPRDFPYVKPYYSGLRRYEETGITGLVEHCWEVCIHCGKLPSRFDGLFAGECRDLPER